MMVNCPVCGKLTAIYWPEFWVYRRKDTFYCSENCMIVDEVRDLKLMNQVARERRLRKEATKMANHKLTLEQKKKAVEIAAQGGNPTEYLKKCGAKNPYAAWDYIKKTLAMKDPVLAEKVDKVPTLVGGSEWAKLPDVIGEVEKVEEKNGGIEVTFTPVNEPPKEAKKNYFTHPSHIDGFEIIGVRGQFGIYKANNEVNYFDFQPFGGELCMSPKDWKDQLIELNRAMKVLGVDL